MSRYGEITPVDNGIAFLFSDAKKKTKLCIFEQVLGKITVG